MGVSFLGKKIEGRDLVNELIGVGGMANVYKATDVVTGKEVAVKILREEFYQNEEFLRRFKNESKAIAVLSHPNIIEVYDVCFTHNIRCIVMEYVDGMTIKDIIRDEFCPPLRIMASEEEVYELALQQNFVPIVDDRNCFCGIVTRQGILRYMAEQLAEARSYAMVEAE